MRAAREGSSTPSGNRARRSWNKLFTDSATGLTAVERGAVRSVLTPRMGERMTYWVAYRIGSFGVREKFDTLADADKRISRLREAGSYAVKVSPHMPANMEFPFHGLIDFRPAALD